MEWSTVSKAADKSRRIREVTSPWSITKMRSLWRKSVKQEHPAVTSNNVSGSDFEVKNDSLINSKSLAKLGHDYGKILQGGWVVGARQTTTDVIEATQLTTEKLVGNEFVEVSMVTLDDLSEGSQCRSIKTGDMWSKHFKPQIRWAAEFNTDCTNCKRDQGNE